MFVKCFWGDFMKILDYFCTESQAAELLGVNRATIWRWIKGGKLSSQRLGSQVVLVPKWEVELIKKTKKTK